MDRLAPGGLRRPVRFSLTCPIEDVGSKLLDGRVAVEGSCESGARFRLDLFEGLRGWLRVQAFVRHIPTLDASQLRAVCQHLQAHLVGDTRDYGVHRLQDGTRPGEMTQAIVPVGLLSLDGEAVLGRNGQVFLVRGTNNLDVQYATDPADHAAIEAARTWMNTFRARASYLKKAGVDFIQCVIPEKSSVLRDEVPAPLPGATAIMRNLRRNLDAATDLRDVELDAYGVLSAPDVRPIAYQTLDTHLAAGGARALASAIARRLGVPTFDDIALDGTLALGGDVGRRLLSPHARADVAVPVPEATAHLERHLRRIEHVQAAHSIGTRVVYRNASALAPRLKVVAFANSFFDVGDNATQASWWLARLFGEYHFVWSPEMRRPYVEEARPDLVICQTIERFLSRHVAS